MFYLRGHDSDYDCWAEEEGNHIYHPIGTCKMGIDDMAVVDPELREHALKGLHVVYASIIPPVIDGNINAPTIMIAEKASHMILQSCD